MTKVAIVDATAQFIRNYAVVPTLTKHGDPNGGVFGFLRTLVSIVHHCKPDRLILVWDGAGGSKKRRAIIPEYKQGRKPVRLNRNFEFELDDVDANLIRQRQRIAEYLKDLPVTQVTIDNVEADDVIAYLSQYLDDDERVVASSDQDFHQLLNESVTIFKPKSKTFFVAEDLYEKHSIRPYNFAVARAVVGDKSDKLVGVKGIGLKKLIKMFPFMTGDEVVTVEQVLDFAEKNGEKYKRFTDVADIIKKNYKVMQLKSPIISFNSIQKINESLTNELRYNATSFRMKLMEDGIQSLSDSYMSFFKPLYQRGQ